MIRRWAWLRLFVSFLSGHFIFWPHYWNQMVAGLFSPILAIASVPVSTSQLFFTRSDKKKCVGTWMIYYVKCSTSTESVYGSVDSFVSSATTF